MALGLLTMLGWRKKSWRIGFRTETVIITWLEIRRFAQKIDENDGEKSARVTATREWLWKGDGLVWKDSWLDGWITRQKRVLSSRVGILHSRRRVAAVAFVFCLLSSANVSPTCMILIRLIGCLLVCLFIPWCIYMSVYIIYMSVYMYIIILYIYVFCVHMSMYIWLFVLLIYTHSRISYNLPLWPQGFICSVGKNLYIFVIDKTLQRKMCDCSYV